ncbi:hypothetical protein [Thiohalorhabdus methylotrophus]|uniref:DUF3307 domain-containing protein n=1 Tax=Thiohalorhabdus methylotrophus TaxID=3242694 RepID=A0ABV4TTW4_9GAMM
MSPTFLALLVAHLLGEFVLRRDPPSRPEGAPIPLLLHAALVTALSALLLGTLNAWLLGSLLLVHSLSDASRSHLLPRGPRSFLGEQGVRLALLAGLAWSFPGAWETGLWGSQLTGDALRTYAQVLVVTAGILATVPAAGVVIGLLLEPLTRELEEEQSPAGGLRNGGRYIGWLERGLVLILYLSGQASGIGFVLATKSILRFGEIKDSEHRKLAEFILIGTFLSFALALSGGLLTEWALGAIRAD